MSEDKKKQSSDSETESILGRSASESRPRIKRIRQYAIESILGAGGMGTIYKAYDESMRRIVALKILHTSMELSESAQTRFAREAWIAGQLDHPNIIKVFDRGEENGISYFVMEYASGGSLAELIGQMKVKVDEGVKSPSTDASYVNSIIEKFVSLAQALHQVHSQGFIHRDIKPHNILISGPDGDFKLSDFGIAHAKDMTRLTEAGDFIGTVVYMSPELLTAHRATVDYRTDIYSLGATIYETVSLALPYSGDSQEKYITEIMSGRSIPLRKRIPEIGQDLETVIAKCLHHDPTKRYQSASDVSDDLNRILRDEPIRAKREPLFSRAFRQFKRHRILAGIVILTAVTVASLSWWIAKMRQAEQVERDRIHLEQRQQLQDERAIVSTLETVQESGISPFKINPDWSRLSKLAFDQLEESPKSRISVELLKCMNLLEFKVLEHCLYETGQFWAEGKEIEGITDVAQDRWTSGGLRNTLKKTRYFASIDGQYEKLVAVAAGVMYKTGFGIDFLLRELAPPIGEGIHRLQIRWETEVYANSGLAVMIGNAWSDLGLGFYVFEQESPDSIYDISSKALSKPFLKFTGEKDFNIWIHDSYPSDFPREIIDSGLVSLYQSSVKIDTLEIVKVPRHEYRTYPFRLVFAGNVKTHLPHPVAAEFEVFVNGRSNPIVEGAMLIYDGKFATFDLEAERYREKQGAVHRKDGVYSSLVVDEGFDVLLDSTEYSKMIGSDLKKGSLRLTPSRELAFETSHYHEYWGLAIDVPVHVIIRSQDSDIY